MAPLLGDFGSADRLPTGGATPVLLHQHIARLWIADLHDSYFYAMESESVIEIFLHQADDLRNGLRRLFRIRLEFNVAFRRFENDHGPGARGSLPHRSQPQCKHR